MCIIVAKESGIAFPSKKTLQNCFDSNPDGAGYMFSRAGLVHIHKGFMTFAAFWKAVTSEKLHVKDTVIYHFRIGTSGASDGSACHPFPVTNNVDALKNTRVSCNMAVVHNGVFGPGSGDLSDTMLFIRDILSYPAVREQLENSAIQRLLSGYIKSSKLVVLTPIKLLYFGNFITYKEIKYSNNGYLPYLPATRPLYRFREQDDSAYRDFIRAYRDDFGPDDTDPGSDDFTGDTIETTDDTTAFDCPECGGIAWHCDDMDKTLFECDTCGAIYEASGNNRSLVW